MPDNPPIQASSISSVHIPFAEHIGIEILPSLLGKAHLRATVQAHHTNRFGTAHGGFLNTLADTALEIASNSYGVEAVALATNMQYHKTAPVGATLEIHARESHRGRSTATYHIDIFAEDVLIATFTGTVFRKHPAVPPAANP